MTALSQSSPRLPIPLGQPAEKDAEPLLRGSFSGGLVIGVIGSGAIGPDLAYGFVSAVARDPRAKVYLVDIRKEALDAGMKRILGYVQKGVSRGNLSPKAAAAVEAARSPDTYTTANRLPSCALDALPPSAPAAGGALYCLRIAHAARTRDWSLSRLRMRRGKPTPAEMDFIGTWLGALNAGAVSLPLHTTSPPGPPPTSQGQAESTFIKARTSPGTCPAGRRCSDPGHRS